MKTRKLFSRGLAVALSVLMLLGAAPTPALAANDGVMPLGDTGESSGIILNKTAQLQDDGTYTINLEAYATGEKITTTTTTPTDVVLVLDVSGSMEKDFDFVDHYEYVEDKTTQVKNGPDTILYHKCPDGTWGTITWTEKGNTGLATYRYVCDHCKATRKWSMPLSNKFGDSKDDNGKYDPWNLYRYEGVTIKKNKMLALQDAAKAFVDGVAEKNSALSADQKHRVSIVKFASETTMDTIGNDTYKDGSYIYNYTQTVAGLTAVDGTTAGELKGKIDELNYGGATAADKGLGMAQGILANSGDRQKVVVLFTDGDPTYGNSFSETVANNAVTTAKVLKGSGTLIYTVGLFTGANPADTSGESNAYLNAVSSNYPDATSYTILNDGGNNGYYKTVNETQDLTAVFKEISESVGTTTVTLGADSVIKDIVANQFVLTESSTVTVKEAAYKERDRDGNYVFATAANSTLQAVVNGNTVSVTGFDFTENYLLDGTTNNEGYTPAEKGKKIIITITGVEATDAAIEAVDAAGAVDTNLNTSGIYEDARSESAAAVFPIPQTTFASKSYMLDYAKPVTLSDLPSDAKLTAGYDWDAETRAFNAKAGESFISLPNGTFDAATNTYTPNTMSWNGYDSFYAFGDAATEFTTNNGHLWTKVFFIPANNVYYEDTFATIKYEGKWTTETAGDNAGEVNTGEHGWVTSLADDEMESDGTSASADAAGAVATFSFTGTGVDVYSRTNATTGLVRAQLYTGNNTTAAANLTKVLAVDNLAQSGNYYQIPTVSFSGLDYGTYTVKLTVGAKDGRSTYFLDGIRVYNPLVNADTTVAKAYGDELSATFKEVRDILLDAKTLSADTKNAAGIVFIDYNPADAGNHTTAEIGTYEDYGPKNEVYLAKDQAIAFEVADPADKISVGLKAPSGAETTAQVTNGSNTSSITISHASDLYYEITPNGEGFVVIKNTGTNLLSVTKLKTSENAAMEAAEMPAMMAYVEEFDTLPVVAYAITPEIPQLPVTPEVPETPAPGGETEEPAEDKKDDFQWIFEFYFEWLGKNGFLKSLWRR